MPTLLRSPALSGCFPPCAPLAMVFLLHTLAISGGRGAEEPAVPEFWLAVFQTNKARVTTSACMVWPGPRAPVTRNISFTCRLTCSRAKLHRNSPSYRTNRYPKSVRQCCMSLCARVGASGPSHCNYYVRYTCFIRLAPGVTLCHPLLAPHTAFSF